jgi:hypothetical protein
VDDYIESACRDSLSKLDSGRHESFAQAIRMSMRIDVDYCNAHDTQFPEGNRRILPVRDGRRPRRPKIATIAEITRDTGFDNKDLHGFKIALGRPEAFDFLSTLTTLAKTVFEKHFTVDAYVRKFGHSPTDMGRSRLLLTYAEWIHFVGLTHSPQVPRSLDRLFRGGD